MKTLLDYGMRIEPAKGGGWNLNYEGGSYRHFELKMDAEEWADYEIGDILHGESAGSEMTETNIGL